MDVTCVLAWIMVYRDFVFRDYSHIRADFHVHCNVSYVTVITVCRLTFTCATHLHKNLSPCGSPPHTFPTHSPWLSPTGTEAGLKGDFTWFFIFVLPLMDESNLLLCQLNCHSQYCDTVIIY